MLKVIDKKLTTFNDWTDGGLPIGWICSVEHQTHKQKKDLGVSRSFLGRIHNILRDKTVFFSSLLVVASQAFIWRGEPLIAMAASLAFMFFLGVVEEYAYRNELKKAGYDYYYSVVVNVDRIGKVTIYETELNQKGGQLKAINLADRLREYLSNSEFTDLIGANVFISYSQVKLLHMVTVGDIEDAIN